MSNIVKDLAAILFSAGEELEKKAEEYKQHREKRQDEFEDKLRQQKEVFKEKHHCNSDNMKEKFTETASRLGLATKEDVDELKEMILDLNDKIKKQA